jgi:hypothetical protein
MTGYLTRLAARSLNRTETIGPRPVSRFEELRHSATLHGVERETQETTFRESTFGRDVHHQRGMPDPDLVQMEDVSAAVQPPFESPRLIPDEAGGQPVTTAMRRITSDLAVRRESVRQGAQERPPTTPPDAPVHPRMGWTKPPVDLKPIDTPDKQGEPAADKGRQGDPLGEDQTIAHQASFKPRSNRTLRRTEAVRPVPYSRLVPSVRVPVSQLRTTSPSTEPQRPIIKVTIGRIDVRAIMPPPTAKAPRAQARPSLSLQDYLSRRPGGPR